MNEKKPDFQEVIDQFAAYDLEKLRSRVIEIGNIVRGYEGQIKGIDARIDGLRHSMQKLEAEQKEISDTAWPYSLMLLVMKLAIEQKEAQS